MLTSPRFGADIAARVASSRCCSKDAFEAGAASFDVAASCAAAAGSAGRVSVLSSGKMVTLEASAATAEDAATDEAAATAEVAAGNWGGAAVVVIGCAGAASPCAVI